MKGESELFNVHVHVCIRTCTCMYMYVYIHVCTCMYTYMYVHVCIRTCQGWRKQLDFGMAVAPENEAYIRNMSACTCPAGSAIVSRADSRICPLSESASRVLINYVRRTIAAPSTP